MLHGDHESRHVLVACLWAVGALPVHAAEDVGLSIRSPGVEELHASVGDLVEDAPGLVLADEADEVAPAGDIGGPSEVPSPEHLGTHVSGICLGEREPRIGDPDVLLIHVLRVEVLRRAGAGDDLEIPGIIHAVASADQVL